jgi:hypothetical protein
MHEYAVLQFDNAACELALSRKSSDPLQLTEADFGQLAIMSKHLAEEARDAQRGAQLGLVSDPASAGVLRKQVESERPEEWDNLVRKHGTVTVRFLAHIIHEQMDIWVELTKELRGALPRWRPSTVSCRPPRCSSRRRARTAPRPTPMDSAATGRVGRRIGQQIVAQIEHQMLANTLALIADGVPVDRIVTYLVWQREQLEQWLTPANSSGLHAQLLAMRTRSNHEAGETRGNPRADAGRWLLASDGLCRRRASPGTGPMLVQDVGRV